MAKTEYYNNFVGVKLSDEQLETIDNANMKRTVYIRNAIDFYSSARLKAYNNIKIEVIDECIEKLNNFKQNVKSEELEALNKMLKNVNKINNNGENVKQNNGVLYKENNTPEQVLNNFTEKTLNNTTENVKQLNFEQLQKDAPDMIQTLANIYNLNGKITNDQFKKQANKHGYDKKELKKIIEENYSKLAEMYIQHV